MRAQLAALLAGLILSGCAVTVKESRVFRPEQAEKYASTYRVKVTNGRLLEDADALEMFYFTQMLDAKDEVLDAPSGALETRHVRSPDHGQPLFVFCGGTSFVLGTNSDYRTSSLGKIGDVLFWSYPGYGESEGAPTSANLRSASETVLEALDTYRHPDQPVVFWGHSLGGFVCSTMAAQYDVRPGARTTALILETTAPSVEAGVKAFAPRVLGIGIKLKLGKGFENIDIPKTLAARDFPVLVLSGAKDTILPVPLSRDLVAQMEALGKRPAYIEYPEGGHTNLKILASFNADIVDFLGPCYQARQPWKTPPAKRVCSDG